VSEKDDKSVLGNLPSTRPARIGRRREGASARAEAPAATATKPKPKATAAKAKPAPKAAASKPRSAASKPKAPSKPKAAAKPRPVRSGSPSLERPKRTEPTPPKPQSTPPKGAELITTTVQAVGELAQIGVTFGGQVAKRALKRLPKP
jgi:hypothetical protein